jgi:hypothetical protein
MAALTVEGFTSALKPIRGRGRSIRDSSRQRGESCLGVLLCEGSWVYPAICVYFAISPKTGVCVGRTLEGAAIIRQILT